jgi:hypothetical protein
MKTKDFNELLMGTRGILWELFGNLTRIQPVTSSKNKKASLGGMLVPPNWLSSQALS